VYFAWVQDAFVGREAGASSRREAYDRFVRRWPDLEAWFAEPLLVRLDLAHRPWGTRRRTGPSSEGGSYITYLSLVHGVGCDVDWVVSRNCGSLFDPGVGPRLGFDLDLLAAHGDRMAQLGYSPSGGARAALTWAFSRLALWRGDPDITTITYDELVEFRDGIRRYCEHPDAGYIRASHVAAVRRGLGPEQLVAQFAKACQVRLHVLHVLLFNIGQVAEAPLRELRRTEAWRDRLTPPETPPALAAPVERWLALRLNTQDRAESVRAARDSFRYLLRWLGDAHPEITSLTQLNRAHMEEFVAYLHDYLNPRNGRPLSAQTRYTYLSPLLQFFRDTSQWGWDDVPGRPLLSRSDLPKLPLRLPRFIPRDELDRLMAAVETIDDPYQRTAILLLRWSGARRHEIARLALDCLDAYPDGYPRLRIPVGKTHTERMVPLHPQAAEALRELIALSTEANAAARHDRAVGRAVRFVFTRRGQPMSRHFLFSEPLERACAKAGLLGPDGRPTITPHRFRHTVGTQLAEGGARIQTIMAILGHRNATMSSLYSRISDPVVKEHYERIIAAGARLAGPAADALLADSLDPGTIDWLKSSFFKTELELGHCLRLPQEGPCECDLFLRCPKFLTTSEYAPRLRTRLATERQLAQDAVERNWPRVAERHTAIANRIRELLAQLGEPAEEP
jgi:integrase